jgi:alanyl-tRNA synthetase
MSIMKAQDIRKKYLQFFISKDHKEIPDASLIPQNDPTVLFTTAGMHPLVPFLLGQQHPLGRRLVNVQRCLRTDDIDEVGDDFHLTFFEMLGNWSLGDYFKKQAIEWSYEFLTNENWLGLDPKRIFVSVFEGDSNAPRDDESASIWLSLGLSKTRIYFLPKKDNWWGPAGQSGPCGPDTEMFYDTLKDKCGKDCKPGCGCGKYVEIWNDVFMQYNKTQDGKYEPLPQKNVDTGMGLERMCAAMTGKSNVYETELFLPVIKKIKSLASKTDIRSERIVADHMRATVFILGDDKPTVPSNIGQGYILRRLIRRAIRHARLLGINENFTKQLAKIIIDNYCAQYHILQKSQDFILSELEKEEDRFRKKLEIGMQHFTKIVPQNNTISGKDAFLLFQSFGFPIEMTQELAKENGWNVDRKEFDLEFERHQELSRKSTEGIFKSGLSDNSDISIRYHTATHLLNEALRQVLGDGIKQRGSNITPERLRFDFNFSRKLTQDEITRVESLVNRKVLEALQVTREEMPLGDALKSGAQCEFGAKYPSVVSVYTIGNFSKEICTGPHVKNTKDVGHFRIIKEEGVAAGVRRIKAVVE